MHYIHGQAISYWSTNTNQSSEGTYQLVLQARGNMEVIQVGSAAVIFQTNTSGQGVGPYQLSLSDSGGLSLMDSTGLIIWQAENNAGVKTMWVCR